MHNMWGNNVNKKIAQEYWLDTRLSLIRPFLAHMGAGFADVREGRKLLV